MKVSLLPLLLLAVILCTGQVLGTKGKRRYKPAKPFHTQIMPGPLSPAAFQSSHYALARPKYGLKSSAVHPIQPVKVYGVAPVKAKAVTGTYAGLANVAGKLKPSLAYGLSTVNIPPAIPKPIPTVSPAVSTSSPAPIPAVNYEPASLSPKPVPAPTKATEAPTPAPTKVSNKPSPPPTLTKTSAPATSAPTKAPAPAKYPTPTTKAKAATTKAAKVSAPSTTTAPRKPIAVPTAPADKYVTTTAPPTVYPSTTTAPAYTPTEPIVTIPMMFYPTKTVKTTTAPPSTTYPSVETTTSPALSYPAAMGQLTDPYCNCNNGPDLSKGSPHVEPIYGHALPPYSPHAYTPTASSPSYPKAPSVAPGYVQAQPDSVYAVNGNNPGQSVSDFTFPKNGYSPVYPAPPYSNNGNVPENPIVEPAYPANSHSLERPIDDFTYPKNGYNRIEYSPSDSYNAPAKTTAKLVYSQNSYNPSQSVSQPSTPEDNDAPSRPAYDYSYTVKGHVATKPLSEPAHSGKLYDPILTPPAPFGAYQNNPKAPYTEEQLAPAAPLPSPVKDYGTPTATTPKTFYTKAPVQTYPKTPLHQHGAIDSADVVMPSYKPGKTYESPVSKPYASPASKPYASPASQPYASPTSAPSQSPYPAVVVMPSYQSGKAEGSPNSKPYASPTSAPSQSPQPADVIMPSYKPAKANELPASKPYAPPMSAPVKSSYPATYSGPAVAYVPKEGPTNSAYPTEVEKPPTYQSLSNPAVDYPSSGKAKPSPASSASTQDGGRGKYRPTAPPSKPKATYSSPADSVDDDAIPGEPGVDYPIYSDFPDTGFSCADYSMPGYYADVETRCQVFHVCWEDRQWSFLCPNGTIFSQEHFVCVWWDAFECDQAPGLYDRNERLFKGAPVSIYDEGLGGYKLSRLLQLDLDKHSPNSLSMAADEEESSTEVYYDYEETDETTMATPEGDETSHQR